MTSLPGVSPEVIEQIVAIALGEDIGSGDVTTAATANPDAHAVATITQKQPGVVYGLACAKAAFEALDANVSFESRSDEGIWRDGGEVATIRGAAQALLSAERTALNLLGRLSGVATLTARYVQAVDSTGAKILDTRKTTPGLRTLEKAAVAAGGAVNHRIGLFDAFLIKENHIAMAGGITQALEQCRKLDPTLLLEVECQTLAQLAEAIDAGAQRVLLDNMDTSQLAEAVSLAAGRVELEASGGVDLESVRGIAQTGVDFISVGALTHSAPVLDLSMLIEPLQ